MRIPVFLLISFKILSLAYIFSILQTQPAHADRGLNEKPRLSLAGFYCEKGLAPGNYRGNRVCRPCGGRYQPACEARRIGKQCTAAYTQKNDDDICEPRGGNNQPKLRGIGYDCRPGYNLGSNDRCTTCGGNNQIRCEAGRANGGGRCNGNLDSYKGTCYAKGYNGQPAWPRERIGFRCNEADLAPDSDGNCAPCGRDGQPHCETLRPGDRCTQAYTQDIDGICEARGGLGQKAFKGIGFDCRPGLNYRKGSDGVKRCEPCGGQGELICEILREGYVCDDDLTQDFRWGRDICVADEPEMDDLVYEASIAMLKEVGSDIFNAVVPMSVELHEDQETLDGINNEEDGAADGLEEESRSITEAFDFKTLTVGATAEANFIIGIGVEAGAAFDITKAKKPFKWYSAVGVSNQLGAGSSYGAVVGVWNSENDGLGKAVLEGGSKSVGIVMDIRRLREIAGYKQSLLTDIGTQSSPATLLIGVWFERDDDATNWSELDFAGFTFSPVLGVGSNIAGTTYVEATTFQSAAPSSGSTGLNQLNNLSTTTLAGGTKLQRCFGQCWVQGLGGEPPATIETFPVADDPSLQAISASGTRARTPVARPSADTQLAGSLWMFEVQGNKFYLKVVEQTADKIIIQRANSTEQTAYNRTASGEYIANTGQRISISNAAAGQWISADGARSYQMSRAN